eukprot:CAMPEP_0172501370 /NCGR_PEP_ID=MMETSP1066-20121228/149111_1 /TAXON_ID=671091 /ORGANISM="Coscinodiscus wailesii, Strain CCMP2513" /LENGTH=493 /DNA_ID=CAMNT_0013276125 /DNA_START=64 /DNA_END=1545 /DNA_ORIENTATION=+
MMIQRYVSPTSKTATLAALTGRNIDVTKITSHLPYSTKTSNQLQSSPNTPRFFSSQPLSSSTATSTHDRQRTNERRTPPTPYCIRTPNGRFQRPIYVAATKQHVGKTSVSIALLAGLQKRFDKVGFIKPVGQVAIPVRSSQLNETIYVDKDVGLIKEHFGLDHLDYKDMSPVIIPRGYTKNYLDGHICHETQVDDIRVAFGNIRRSSDVLLCEGTGHCAVGSVVNLNNARVAAMIGADMVLVANGGLGSAIDELELNRVLCQHHGVRLAGVIINKVIFEKYDETKRRISKILNKMWHVPLLGCVPDKPFLGCPALADLEKLYNSKLMCGEQHRMRHYNVSETNLVTTSVCQFRENLRNKPSRTLYFCHSTRDDVILAFIAEYIRKKNLNESFEAALVVCGRKEKYTLSPQVLHATKTSEDVPILPVQLSTHQAMEVMHNFTPKLNSDDKNRVNSTIAHYNEYIDYDELLRRTQAFNSSFDDPTSAMFADVHRL